MMSDNEMRQLAKMIVIEQANNEQWMMAFAKAQAKLQKKERCLVSAKKAAEMLGISVWQLYRIKDDESGRPQFSYTKGESQSSPLKFDSSVLLEEYERYLSRKKFKVVQLRSTYSALT
jgi:hypothetical protein